MTTACPKGHTSQAEDYCDVCGARIGAPSEPPAPTPEPPAPTAEAPAPTAEAQTHEAPTAAPQAERICPSCGAHNPGAGRYCEDCGADLDAPAGAEPAAPAAQWEAVAVADRDYYERVETEGLEFPLAAPERHFALTGDRATIGRRSASKGITPDIDLSAAPQDAGISHHHAVLLRQPEGTWAVVDPGSTNGTYLNDSLAPLPRNQVTPLHDNDRLYLGAWTSITLRPRRAEPPDG